MAKAQSYQLVTSTEGLVDRGKYLIVSKECGDALSTEQGKSNRGAQVVSFAQDGSIDAATLNANVAIIQLINESNDLWSLQVTNGSTQGYLYAAGTKTSRTNYLKTTKTPTDCDYRAEITI